MHALHVPTECGGGVGGVGRVVLNCKMYFLPPQKGKPKLTAKKIEAKNLNNKNLLNSYSQLLNDR